MRWSERFLPLALLTLAVLLGAANAQSPNPHAQSEVKQSQQNDSAGQPLQPSAIPQSSAGSTIQAVANH